MDGLTLTLAFFGLFPNDYDCRFVKNKVFRELETEPFEVLTDDVAVEMDEVLYTDEFGIDPRPCNTDCLKNVYS